MKAHNPHLHRHLLAGVAALALTVPVAAEAARTVGKTTAANEVTTGTPPAMDERRILLGTEIIFEEVVATNENGRTQIVFEDQSAITIGPNARLVIDRFVYEPETRTGDFAVSLTEGLFRFVGGRISKSSPVEVNTPAATIGIRGGIALVRVDDGGDTTEATCLFCEELTVTPTDGSDGIAITRNGFGTTVRRGLGASTPERRDSQGIGQAMRLLEGRPGDTGGVTEPPDGDDVGRVLQAGAPSDGAPAGGTPPGTQVTPLVDGGDEGDTTPDDVVREASTNRNQSAGDTEDATTEPVIEMIGGARHFDGSTGSLRGLNNPTNRPLLDVDGTRQGDTYSFQRAGGGGRTLGGPANALTVNGIGPDGIPNPFFPEDESVYDRADDRGLHVFTDEFVWVDWVAPVDDGRFDDRLTLFAGQETQSLPTSGISGYRIHGDTQLDSFHPFSRVGRYQIPGVTDAYEVAPGIPDEAATNGLLLIDWDTGKAFQVSAVDHGTGYNPWGQGAFQIGVMAGDVVDGRIEGAHADMSVFRRFGTDKSSLASRTFGIGDFESLGFFGNGADHLVLEGSQSAFRRWGGPQTLNYLHLAEREDGEIVQRNQLEASELAVLSAGLVLGPGGDPVPLMTDPLSPGELVIDRDAGEITLARLAFGFPFFGGDDIGEPGIDGPEGGVGGLDFIEMTPGDGVASAWLDQDRFAMVGPSSDTEGGAYLLSGRALNPGDDCDCEEQLWGWFGFVMDEGIFNTQTEIGASFVAGVPTVDTPTVGTATYSGVANATRYDISGPIVGLPVEGAWVHTIDFGDGIGFGQLDIGGLEFDIVSVHEGGPAFDLVFLGDGEGYGSGLLFAEGGGHLGATFTIAGSDYALYTGTFRGDRSLDQIDGFARHLGNGDPAGTTAIAEVAGSFDGVDYYILNEDQDAGLLGPAGELLAVFGNVADGPDGIANPFFADDGSIYDTPATTSENMIAAGLGEERAARFGGLGIFRPQFMWIDYTSLGEDGWIDDRLTVFAGTETTHLPEEGVTAYDLQADTQRHSLNAFSRIGRFEQPILGTAADETRMVPDADVRATPLLVDWDRGRIFQASSVFHQGETEGDFAMQFAVVAGGIDPETGEITAGSGDIHNFGFAGGGDGNIGESGITAGSVQSAGFYEWDARFVVLGAEAETTYGTGPDGQGGGAPTSTDFVHLGERTEAPTPDDTTGTSTRELYAVAEAYGPGVSGLAFTDADSPGALEIDHDAGTVQAGFSITDGDSTIHYHSGSPDNGAYFDSSHFGVAATRDGVSEGGALFMASGRVIAPGAEPCECEYLEWGYWAAHEERPGELANQGTEIGTWYAATPTVEMPMEGTASYGGHAHAMVQAADGVSPQAVQGSFTQTVDFATGTGDGTLSLLDRSFASTADFAQGSPHVDMSFREGKFPVGEGAGTFSGPDAANFGANFGIETDDHFRAHGTIAAERVAAP